MKAPQIIMLVLMVVSLIYHMSKHGQPKEDENYNFYRHFFHLAIHLALLIWGGFFN